MKKENYVKWRKKNNFKEVKVKRTEKKCIKVYEMKKGKKLK